MAPSALLLASLACLASAQLPNFTPPLDFIGNWTLANISSVGALAQSGSTLFLVTGSSITALNLSTGAVLATMSPPSGGASFTPIGLQTAAPLGVLFASCSDGALHAFNSSAPFAHLYNISLGAASGAMRFDASTGRLWVAYGGGAVPGGLAIVNASAANASLEARLPFPPDAAGVPARPEALVLATGSSLIYASCPLCNSTSIVVVNRATRSLVTQWPTQPLSAQPAPNALDEKGSRLFVATQSTSDPRLLVLNAGDGSVVWSAPVDTGCGGVEWDAPGGLIYVVCGGGIYNGSFEPSAIYVAKQTLDEVGADHVLLGSVDLPLWAMNLSSARTSLLDTGSNRLYVAVPAVAPAQVAQILLFTRTSADVVTATPSPTPASTPSGGFTGTALASSVAGAVFGGAALALGGMMALGKLKAGWAAAKATGVHVSSPLLVKPT